MSTLYYTLLFATDHPPVSAGEVTDTSFRWCQLTSARICLDMFVYVSVWKQAGAVCLCPTVLFIVNLRHTYPMLVIEYAVARIVYFWAHMVLCVYLCTLSSLVCVCLCVCVDTAPCQRRFEASSVTVRAEASWVVGRLCLSALLDPVIHQAQSAALGTDHHLLQQVKNIEVTGKDLQPHTTCTHLHLKEEKNTQTVGQSQCHLKLQV